LYFGFLLIFNENIMRLANNANKIGNNMYSCGVFIFNIKIKLFKDTIFIIK